MMDLVKINKLKLGMLKQDRMDPASINQPSHGYVEGENILIFLGIDVLENLLSYLLKVFTHGRLAEGKGRL